MTSPSPNPMRVPRAPMTIPFKTNIFCTLRSVAPMAFKMAISLVFPITIIMRLLAMLKAATRMMRVKMMNMTRLSSFSALNRLRFICIQSRAQKGKPSLPVIFWAILRASYKSVTRISSPVTESPKRIIFWASRMLMYAKVWSYSYIPDSKNPVTLNCRMVGTCPMGDIMPRGDIT